MSVPFVAVNASRKCAIKKWGASGTEAAAPLQTLLLDSAFQRTLVVQLATRWREVGAQRKHHSLATPTPWGDLVGAA